MRILASPARLNRHQNPFNFLLSEALAAQGCEVFDLDRDNAFGRCDVLHIHWPQQVAKGPRLRAWKRSFDLVMRLLVQRIRGARVVWTVHNVRGHDQKNVALERGLMRAVVALVHGVIFLSPSSQAAAYEEMPALAAKPFAIIPHGLYGDRSDKSRAEARAAFGLPPTGPVIGFLGDIKPYKGLETLLDGFEQTRPGEITLLVAGTALAPAYRSEIRDRLSALSAKGHAIVFREERLGDAALADAIRACDAVALLYRAIWNSGLALLVLENRGRILASDAPVFRELEREVGPEWVQVADVPLTAERLAAVVSRQTDAEVRHAELFDASRSWPRIGAATVAFYRQLGAP